MWEATHFYPLPLDICEKLRHPGCVLWARRLAELDEADQVEVDEPGVIGVFSERRRHGRVAPLHKAKLHRGRNVKVILLQNDLGDDIETVPDFAESGIVEARSE